jgi:hypothetical protein
MIVIMITVEKMPQGHTTSMAITPKLFASNCGLQWKRSIGYETGA